MSFGPQVDRVHSTRSGRPTIVDHVRAARAAAAEAGFDARAFQIFVANPRSLSITLRDDEADELQAYLSETRIVAIAHGTYMDFPWGGNAYAAKFIRGELALCARAGISGLVVHLGKAPAETVLKYIPRLISVEQTVAVFLEVPHVKPENSHYETPEKLAALFREIRARFDPLLCRFGLCIDTAHLWSCGVDLRSYEDAEEWIRGLEAVADVIPPDRVIIHLNDSLDERGSGVDRHAPLLEGKLWGDFRARPRQSGLAAFVDYAVRNDTTVILERSAPDKKPPEALLNDYAVLYQLTTAVRCE